MKVESATFEMLAEPPAPEWVLRVSAKGSGLAVGARALCARVGGVAVEGLLENDDLGGFVGYLRSVPPDGSHLFVGYDPGDVVDTGIEFQAPPIA